ncbi:MAG: hemin-degrading factor [Ramlibacter sp.]|nr:hemin-degrading factor [Ramlibacter sp.]
MNAQTIRKQFSAARAAGHAAADAAEFLGVSEGEALAAHADGHDGRLKVIPLRGPRTELARALEGCGPLLARSSNDFIVHEVAGTCADQIVENYVGQALGRKIELQMFFDRWHAGFAVQETAGAGEPSLGLHFFNVHGVAVHKVYACEGTDLEAFHGVIERFSEPGLAYLFRNAPPKPVLRPDELCDTVALAHAWNRMSDTCQFAPMLRRLDIERQQSFRLMEGRFAWRTSFTAVRELMQEASTDRAGIAVIIRDPKFIRVDSGRVRHTPPAQIKGPARLTVLAPSFNLHMREDRIAQAWIVKKPTAAGIATTVEVFNAKSDLMVALCDHRELGSGGPVLRFEAFRPVHER